jgi:Bacterial transcriptional activator domain
MRSTPTASSEWRQGRERLALGEPERAAYAVTQALDLWRGRAFEDVESWDLHERVAQPGGWAAPHGCSTVLTEELPTGHEAPFRQWSMVALTLFVAACSSPAQRFALLSQYTRAP